MSSSEPVNLDLTYEETMRVILAYKKQGVLWNPHLFGFHNRQVKEEAWRLVSAEANIEVDICRRKLKSLTSSCRREKSRIISSRRSGNPEDVREPRWRYWNAFKFLRGLEDNDEDPLGTAPEMDILDPALESPALKAKYKSSKSSKHEAFSHGNKEEPSIGSIVASKLRKMYPDQRLYAENLINQALFKGSLSKLTSHSKIRTPDFQTSPDEQKPSTSKSPKEEVPIIESWKVCNTPDPLASGGCSPESSDFELSDDIK